MPRQFTGFHMAAVMAAFFGVIVAVNIVMATFASTSWTGLVVKNSYVASRNFNEAIAARRRQDRLGWSGEFEILDGRVSYRLKNGDGRPVNANAITLAFKRPAFESDDHDVVLSGAGAGLFVANYRPADGVWVIEVIADAGLEAPWRDSFRVSVDNGRLSP